MGLKLADLYNFLKIREIRLISVIRDNKNLTVERRNVI